MATYQIGNRVALAKIDDLTTPSATQAYPLGMEVVVEDNSKTARKRYKYINAATTALVAYTPYAISQQATAGAEVITSAPATTATASIEIGVPQVAFTSGYYGFVAIEGNITAVIPTSTGNNAGNKLKLINGATAFTGTTSAITADGAVAAALVTATTGTSGSVYLYGRKVTITT